VEHNASRREGLPPFTARELDRPGLPSADDEVAEDFRLLATLAGAEAFLALRSYVSTAHKQGMNPLAVLRQLVESRPPATSPGRLLNSYLQQWGCVEVALFEGRVAVRDSKDRQGPILLFTPAEWEAFIKGTREGQFNLG
jgi:hypothetical protein